MAQVGIFGPALSADFSTSVTLMQRLMDRHMPAVPRIGLGLVDVRDTADLHVLAMTNPAASGERFLAVAGPSVTLQVHACWSLTGDLSLALPHTPRHEQQCRHHPGVALTGSTSRADRTFTAVDSMMVHHRSTQTNNVSTRHAYAGDNSSGHSVESLSDIAEIQLPVHVTALPSICERQL